MKHDFLREITQLSHQDGIKVIGYFCVGANRLWAEKHPDQSHGKPNGIHIPLTNDYLDWLVNEHPNPALLESVRNQVGPHTRLIQGICGWEEHDSRQVVSKLASDVGFFGFARGEPTATALPLTAEEAKPDVSAVNARISCTCGSCFTRDRMIELLENTLRELDSAAPDSAPRGVDALLSAARRSGATDVHLQPTKTGLEVKFRLDGVLVSVASFPSAVAGNVTARLKVLAGLLTYHTDRPQEGRIRLPQDDVEMRVCTYPTLHGERAVVRLFGGARRYQHVDDLGLPADVLGPLRACLSETLGAILVSWSGRQRQDDHRLRLPARNCPAKRRRPEPGLDRRPDRSGR